MKRLIKSLWSLALIAAVTIACEEQNITQEESVNISGLQETIDFAAVPAGDVTFTITSNVDWSISQKNLDWVTITPTRGLAADGAQTVTITAEINEAEAERTGTLTVTAGKTVKTATLRQAGAAAEPVFTVGGIENATLTIGALEVSPKTFTVSSNQDWTAVTADLDWAEVAPLEGKAGASATITVTPKAAHEGEALEGTISFAYGADAPYVVKVVREAYIAPELEVSAAELSAEAAGAELSVDVTSNTTWTAVSSADWVTVSPAEGDGNGAVKVTVAANEAAEARTATVTIAAKDVDGLAKTVTVNQAAAEVVPPAGDYIDLAATPVVWCSNNQEWNLQVNPGWATSGQTGSDVKDDVPQGGTGEGTGHAWSYSHTSNTGAYALFVEADEIRPDDEHLFVMTEEGNLTVKALWTDDAIEFHVPVAKIDAGQTLCFDFGMYGAGTYPRYWSAEASLDGGKTYEPFTVDKVQWPNEATEGESVGTETYTSNDVVGNIDLTKSTRTTVVCKSTLAASASVSNAEIIVRIRCIDGTAGRNKTISKPNSGGTVRFIGNDLTGSEFMGPTIYVK